MNATEHYQRTFAAHLRNPTLNPPPAGVDPQRMGVYVRLLFNNVEDFLSGCFPVLRSILDNAQWRELVRQFYAEHACQSPYFREIPAEFVQWLTARQAEVRLMTQFPFLLELAHYEWVEVPLLLDDTQVDWAAVNSDGDLLDEPLVLNPVMLLQSYQYPVQTIAPDTLPSEPQPSHLLLLRNREGKVDFVVLNAVTAHLVQLLGETTTAREALLQLAQALQHPDPEQLLGFGMTILQQLHTQQVILGTSAHRQ